MKAQELPFDFNEKIIFDLRSLYNRHGYAQYKMSKFEEYDLYARNKDFLISDRVITFTDLSGKLMALKPDVTLSIVKNSKDTPDTLQKLYYHENIYRATKGSHCFKEIMQVGLECLGDIDDYCVYEVLSLAAQSLYCISEESLLDISHLGLLSDTMDALGVPEGQKSQFLKYIGEKNLHQLVSACRAAGMPEENAKILAQLASASGAPETVLPAVKKLLIGLTDIAPLEQLQRVTDAFANSPLKSMLHIDFSVVDDVHYYNGIVFKGFINGLPNSVLSGGQYDKLMRKLGRKAGAIGFAVYMDNLERLAREVSEYDVDVLLLYSPDAALASVQRQVQALTDQGYSVMVQRQQPDNVRYKRLMNLSNSEVEILENNA